MSQLKTCATCLRLTGCPRPEILCGRGCEEWDNSLAVQLTEEEIREFFGGTADRPVSREERKS